LFKRKEIRNLETETKSKLKNDVRDVMKGIAIEVIAAAIIALAAIAITAVIAGGSKSK
jgi:hypothetical protein